MNIKLVILTIIVLAYLFQTNSPRSRKNLIVLVCSLFALESGLRGIEVGNDTSSYYMSYYDIIGTQWSEIIVALFKSSTEVRDPGFAVVVKAIGSVIPSWQVYCLISAIFLYISIGKLWNRYIETRLGVLFAAILWLNLFDIIALGGMRQMLTTAIAFYIIPYVEEKRWMIVVPAVIIGSLIHISLLFFMAFVVLSFVPASLYKKMLFVATFLVPVVGIFSQQIMVLMINSMENDYYQGYAEVAEGAKAYTYVYLCTTLSIFIFINYKFLKTAPNFFMMAAVMMTLLVPLILRGGTAIRIGQYFTVYMMVSLPWIMERSNMRKIYYTAMIGVLVLSLITTPAMEYHFFWNSTGSYIYGF